MVGEQISGGAEQSQPPKECWFVNQVGWAATAFIRHTPFVQFCNGCQLTGMDINADYGVGQATFKVKSRALRDAQPPGCPGEGVNVYNAQLPPLTFGRPYTEQAGQPPQPSDLDPTTQAPLPAEAGKQPPAQPSPEQ